MAHEVIFYVTDRGTFPVFESISELNDKEFAKCYSYIELLAERGNTLPSNYIKYLGKELW